MTVDFYLSTGTKSSSDPPRIDQLITSIDNCTGMACGTYVAYENNFKIISNFIKSYPSKMKKHVLPYSKKKKHRAQVLPTLDSDMRR